MTNKLVAYFSATGTTRQKAQQLVGALGADVYEIVPKQPYTNADLNWMDKTSRSSLEMNDPDSRPEIADNAIDVSRYDTVYVGFPIWWYVAPRIIETFLEAHDFAGKRIVLFATSGGSGFGQAVDELKPLVAASTTIEEGALLNAPVSDEKLKVLFK